MKDRALQLLRESLANPSADFRSGQWESIQGILDEKRQLVVQRTGWGKSIVYFMATRLLKELGKGPTIVISPLKSLMRNQKQAAESLKLRTELSNSDNSPQEEAQVRSRVLSGKVDLLLTTPERLADDSFRKEVLQCIPFSLFVVDEAHCISDWGHDFRPDYRRIVGLLKAFPPSLPVLATTATANDRVVDDIRSQLGDSIEVVRGPLIRKSLRLQNLDIPNPIDRYSAIVQILGQIDGSGIIYTLTVNDTIRLTRWLKENGFAAHAYYSDLDKKDKTLRARLEQRLINNDLKVIVATVALGMGFDKPDLAFVIHFQRPSSVVSYYQQVGRAGRSVDEAYGILMGGAEDDDIANYFIRAAFPPQTHVNEVLLALRNSNRSSRYALEPLVNLSRAQIEKTLKFLAAENPSPITKIGSNYIALPASLSYRVDDAHIQNITAIRRNEQVEMQSYMRHEACLMRFLSEALDDPDASDCGKCSGCLGKPLLQKEIDSDIQQKAANFLGRTYQKIKPRLQKPVGTFEVFSKMSNNQSNFSRELCCEEGRALCVWGDPGWGQLVRTGKYPPPGGTMGFDDRLVEACAEMLTDWKPWPEPTWVTAIPSLRHPDLVPDFARRIATRLGLPYVDAIVKTRQGERQRDMENSAHQIANLDGSLKLASSELPKGAVLLIDDMVDSKWTFTIAGYLLRQAKIAAVFPLALALNSVADT